MREREREIEIEIEREREREREREKGESWRDTSEDPVESENELTKVKASI